MTTQREELARILDEWLDDEAPLNLRRYLQVADALAPFIERVKAEALRDATVEKVNRLLGVNLWDARSFRADVRIDFDEYGAVLSATLAEGGA